MRRTVQAVIQRDPVRVDRASAVAISIFLLFVLSSLSGIASISSVHWPGEGQGDSENPMITSDQMAELSDLRSTLRTSGQSNNNHSWTWANAVGSYQDESGASIAVDPSGDLFVTGHFEGSVSFGSTTLSAPSYSEMYVAKLQPDGTWEWAVRGSSWHTRAEAHGYDIATDSQGNAFVTGEVASHQTNGGLYDSRAFVAKIDGNGTWQWTLIENSSSSACQCSPASYGRGIAVDANDDVFVVGYYEGSLALDGHGLNLTTGGDSDGFLIKLDGNGNSLWVKKVESHGSANSGSTKCMIQDVAVDSQLNAYVIGYKTYGEYCKFGSNTVSSHGNSPSQDLLVGKLNSSTNTWEWANRGGTQGVYGRAIAVGPNGSVYVTGDGLLGKLDSTGSWNWGNTGMGVIGCCGDGYGIGVDSNGNLYTTGESGGDIFVRKTDNAGNHIRTENAGSSREDNTLDRGGIALDSNGAAFVTGTFGGQCCISWGTVATFGTINLTAAVSGSHHQDIFVAKFSIDSDYDGWDDDEEASCGTDPDDSSSTPIDTDSDGVCNSIDPDDDGDGYSDADETTNCGESNDPLDSADTPTDTDGDGFCDAVDTDDDGDGVDDTSDSCEEGSADWTSNSTTDYDSDGCVDGNIVLLTHNIETGTTATTSAPLSDGGMAFAGVLVEDTLTLGSHTVTAGSDCDLFVAKMNQSGGWEWLVSFSPSSCTQWPLVQSVSTTSDGGVYVVAKFDNTISVNGTTHTGTPSLVDGLELLVIKLRSDGQVHWSADIGSLGENSMLSSSVSPNDHFSVLFQHHYSSESHMYITSSTGSYTQFDVGSSSIPDEYYATFSSTGAITNYQLANAVSTSQVVADINLHTYVVRQYYSGAQGGLYYAVIDVLDGACGCQVAALNSTYVRSPVSFANVKIVSMGEGVFLWFELSSDSYAEVSSDGFVSTALTITDDHYLLNITRDGGYSEGINTLGYELVHDYRENLLFVENGTRVHTLSDIDSSFTYRGTINSTTHPEFHRTNSGRFVSAASATSWGLSKTFLIEEDADDDNDGLADSVDGCSTGDLSWTSGSITDYDTDGCRDAGEDTDDDNDGVADTSDLCAKGNLGWTSNATNDYDSDGCLDSVSEDADDDNDGIADSSDACQTGNLEWTSNSTTDHDSDGCGDADNWFGPDISVVTTSANNADEIATDPDGNTIVAGMFHGTLTFGGTTLTNTDTDTPPYGSLTNVYDIFVAKLLRNGTWEWALQLDVSKAGGIYLYDIDVDSDGNVFIVGTCKGTITYGSETSDCDGGYDNYNEVMIAKANSDGTWDWVEYASGNGIDNGYGLTVDNEGSAYLTGSFCGSSSSGSFYGCSVSFGSHWLTPASGGGAGQHQGTDRTFVAKIDGDGDWQWASRAGSGYNVKSRGTDLALDGLGGLYVTGWFQSNPNGPMSFGSYTNHQITSNQSQGFGKFLAKLTASGGQWQWARGWDSGWNFQSSISSSGGGYIVLLSHFNSNITLGGYNLTESRTGGNVVYDIMVANISSSGVWQWAISAGGEGNDYSTSVGVDNTGRIFVAGSFTQNASFGSTSMQLLDGTSDGLIASVSPAGVWLDAIQTNQSITDMAVQGTGQLYIIGGDSSWLFLEEDSDDDNDSLDDISDDCATGDLGWTSGSTTDYDSDGCRDAGEDTDDDNDGVADASDLCSLGLLGWASNSTNDYDSDGCQDSNEDLDDDNDGITDLSDDCATGDLGWTSGSTTDHDSDGCRDSGAEDTDDDNDLMDDDFDDCQTGDLGWSSGSTTDYDSDGCQDAGEDTDDDNDGISDSSDDCATGLLGWTSGSTTDHDSDGCQDAGEDADDDNDGMDDVDDDCPTGDLGWTSTSLSDHDSDGCRSAGEDTDDDNDSILDVHDFCPQGDLGWTSNATTDHDTDGCRDDSEDNDDDNDSVLDSSDDCQKGDIGWTSDASTDYDSDGCRDIDIEDPDDDNDSVLDPLDDCQTGDLGWTSDATTDYDTDGCQDSSSEDLDDDNDSVFDTSDDCPTGTQSWSSNSSMDNDADGCLDNPIVLGTQQLVTNGTGLLTETLTDGAVAFAGHFNWPSMTAGSFSVSSNSSSNDVFVGRMAEDGGWDYLVSFGNDGDTESVVDLAPAPDGGVYVLMEYSGEITVNGTTFEANPGSCFGCYWSGAGNINVLLIRVNGDGTIEWTVQFGNQDVDSAWSVDVDSDYNPTILASKWGLISCS